MSTRETFKVKMPQQPGTFPSQEIGIILLNHVGSSSRQDTGRDAQFLADRFRVMTVAADRPTNHSFPRDPELGLRLRHAPVQEMFGLAASLDKLFSDWGVKRAIIAGRSAGGLAALELAQTDGIPAAMVYAAEPAGCQQASAPYSHTRYPAYLKWQKARLKEDAKWHPPALIHPPHDARQLPLTQRLSRLATMLPLTKTDDYYNRAHWSQNLVADYAAELALMHHIPTQLDFAEFSLVLPEDKTTSNAYIDELEQISARGTLGVEIVPRTVHSSFDNRDFFASRLLHASEIHLQQVAQD